MTAMLQFRERTEATPDPAILQAALEACRVGLAVAEAGRIVYANLAFAEAAGSEGAAEMRGRALAECFPELEASSTGAKAGSAEQAGLNFPSGEWLVRRRDGMQLPIRLVNAGRSETGGELLLLTAGGPGPGTQPSPESEKLAALGLLVSGVAHDFNNLLTGILLYCDLLLAGLREPAHAGYVREIRRAGEHSAGLIAQLLALARGEAGGESAASWQEVIAEMHNLLSRLIGEHIALATDLAPGAPKVQIEAGGMRQIILNLVLNARDAMPEGGRIVLAVRDHPPSTAQARDEVELSVTDTGCGMDGETRSHLFEPFFTTKTNTTKSNGRGTGLGLGSVRRLVEQRRGRVEVQSQPGQGTRVSVFLPPWNQAGEEPEKNQR
ncbi:MAG TPA: ATP-binding protein [Terriglobales bacterium]|nr:ATP-binding protein [Terriglobales bacterium]